MSADEPLTKSRSRVDDVRQWLAVVLMPIIVAATGGVISWQINKTNERNAERLETANREIRVMELLIGQLTDPDDKVKTRGVHSLHLFMIFVPSLGQREQNILREIGGRPGQAESVTVAAVSQLGPKAIENSPAGEALYYRGTLLRRDNKKEAVKIFRQYLENEQSLNKNNKIPSDGYFDERTAWVALLLAYDDRYLAERETDRSAKAYLLDDACFALKRSTERRPEGFVKPISVTTDDTKGQVEMQRKMARMSPCPD